MGEPATALDRIPIMKPLLGVEEQQAAAEAIASGWIAQGPRVAEFERAFARRIGVERAVALSNCTTALHLALHVEGVGAGDEVVLPSLSFIATANAARYVGAEPVFADVDVVTQNLTPDTIEPLLTSRTRAVILVDQAGMPADLDAIRSLCDPRGITVVEDAACAIGSTYHGRAVGSGAHLAAFSFHPRKILTTGEGGMLVTDDPRLGERIARLREHGMSVSAAERHAGGAPVLEQYLETGFNFRMTDIQAAVGLVQLTRLDGVVARRREIAALYREGLSDLGWLRTPVDPPWGTTNYQSFAVLLLDGAPVSRDALMAELATKGISTRRGIMAAHLEPAYSGHPHVALPVTELLTHESLILPVFHAMTDADVARVVDAIRTTGAVVR